MRKFICLITIILVSFNAIAQGLTELNKGDKVENFSALDDKGNSWKSSEITSDFLVVYFYPAAMTGGCTKQACAYRDDKESFDKMSVSVVGVSGDEVKNLQYFKEAYQLNFPLLSDNKGTLSKTFGIPTTKGGKITREIGGENLFLIRGITTPRWTFILDKNHTIIYKNAEVNAADDSKKVKAVIQQYINSK